MEIKNNRILKLWKAYFGERIKVKITRILKGEMEAILELIEDINTAPMVNSQMMALRSFLEKLVNDELPPVEGFFRHRKGGLYEVLNEGRHSETSEKLVIYRSCRNGSVWVRPKSMFLSPGRFTNVTPSKESGLLLKSKL